MSRIATMTVIRGEGDCQVLMNSIVQKEIEKINAAHNKEIEKINAAHNKEIDDLKFQLDSLKKQKFAIQESVIENINEMVEKPAGFINTVRDGIEYIWCMIWGMLMAYGLIGDNDKEE